MSALECCVGCAVEVSICGQAGLWGGVVDRCRWHVDVGLAQDGERSVGYPVTSASLFRSGLWGLGSSSRVGHIRVMGYSVRAQLSGRT